MAPAAGQPDGALLGYYSSLWSIFPVSFHEWRKTSLHILIGYPRWRKSDDDVWSCALHGRILSLRQDSTHLHYHATFPQHLEAPPTPPSSVPDSIADGSTDNDDTEALVYHYLNLAADLTGLYKQWATADTNFKKKAPKFAGVRILRQDAWEALVGFICSSNNNILRISQMVCLWEGSDSTRRHC